MPPRFVSAPSFLSWGLNGQGLDAHQAGGERRLREFPLEILRLLRDALPRLPGLDDERLPRGKSPPATEGAGIMEGKVPPKGEE